MTRTGGRRLAFGLFLTPAWMAWPIRDQLGDRAFEDLPADDAADVLEGLGFLQWIRAAVVGFAVLLVAYLTRDRLTFGSGAAGWASLSLLLWLPAYMLVLGTCQQVLRRSPHSSVPVCAAHPRVLKVVGWAPYLAVAVASLLALVLS